MSCVFCGDPTGERYCCDGAVRLDAERETVAAIAKMVEAKGEELRTRAHQCWEDKNYTGSDEWSAVAAYVENLAEDIAAWKRGKERGDG